MPKVEDLQHSVDTRMKSFVKAASYLAGSSGAEDMFADVLKSHKASDMKVNPKKPKKALNHHMEEFNVDLIAKIKERIPAFAKMDDEKIFKELMDAENYNNLTTRPPVITVEDKDGAVIGRAYPKEGGEPGEVEFYQVGADGNKVGSACASLDILMNSLGPSENNKMFVRQENPITKFTKAQEGEWEKILGNEKEQPKWFQKLPGWEKELYKSKVKEWQDTPEAERKNLGDLLGTIPSTIRKYPGAPNAYVTSVKVYDSPTSSRTLFEKVRSGALIPFDIKSDEEKARVTEQNLEQLMADTIQRKMDEAMMVAKASGNDGMIKVSVPMAIQTLFSPPIQPKGGDAILAKAVKNIEKRMEEEGPEFFKRIGVELDPKKVSVSVDMGYVNTPVNKLRSITKVFSGNEKTAVKMLSSVVPTAQRKGLAEAVMKTLSSGEWNSEGLIGGVGVPKHNINSERAALEQILNFAQGGNRIGSCVSGKDREEMITQMAVAMVMYRELHNGELPPPPGTESPEREQFENLVARQFLANHGQKIAAANSIGSDGLKNVDEVYGKSICDKIQKMGANDEVDPLLGTKASAGLNKPEVPPSIGKSVKNFFMKKVLPVIAIATVVIPVVAGIAAAITHFAKSKSMDSTISSTSKDGVPNHENSEIKMDPDEARAILEEQRVSGVRSEHSAAPDAIRAHGKEHDHELGVDTVRVREEGVLELSADEDTKNGLKQDEVKHGTGITVAADSPSGGETLKEVRDRPESPTTVVDGPAVDEPTNKGIRNR